MSVSTRVEFDRKDLTYRSGEPVTGRVFIDTGWGAKCKAVSLSCFWRTRGYGANDQGREFFHRRVHEGPLSGDPPHVLPFQFPAPTDSLSYRGRLFQVEHWAQVAADLGSSGRPAAKAEFKVVPGPLIGPPPTRISRSPTSTRTGQLQTARVAAGSAAMILGILAWPNGLFLVPVGLWLLFPLYRKKVAEQRLGSVTAHPSTRIVAPGRSIHLNLKVRPTVPMKIRGASIRVRAEEICVPPSDKGPTRRRQEIYSSSIRLTGPCVLGPGAMSTFRAEVPIPDKGFYSFSSANNRVEWEARVLVDVPAWPDWEKVFSLVVWPEAKGKIEESDQGILEPPPSVESPRPEPSVIQDPSKPDEPLETRDLPDALMLPEVELDLEVPKSPQLGEIPEIEVDSEVPDPSEGHQFPSVTPPSKAPDTDPLSELQEKPDREMPSRAQESMEPDDLREPPESTDSEGFELDLSDAIQGILAEDTLSGRRDPLIRALLEQVVSFELSVEKVERTFGRFSDSRYRNGRTASGTIAGTDVAVSVWFPEAQNDEVDAMDLGSAYQVNGVVEEWDSLRKRPNVSAREERGETEC